MTADILFGKKKKKRIPRIWKTCFNLADYVSNILRIVAKAIRTKSLWTTWTGAEEKLLNEFLRRLF